MKRQPKVSIILPTYNQEKFIGNAIKSALLQGYDNVEILVRDDSSTDSTYVVAQELAQNYPTKVFVKRNSKNLRKNLQLPQGRENLLKTQYHKTKT